MSWETTPKFDTKTFEQHPPIPEKFWVQKLKKPTKRGSMILSIQFILFLILKLVLLLLVNELLLQK